MCDSKEKIIERARKLFAMANDAGSPNEAAIAAKRVRSLIDRHGITMADLETESEKQAKLSSVAGSKTYKQVPSWYGILAFGVARANDCHVRSVGGTIMFDGFEIDALTSKMMLDYLTGAMERQLKEFKLSSGRTNRATASSFRRGFVSDMQARLFAIHAERKEAVASEEVSQEEATGTAMVMVKKEQIVAEHFGEQKSTKTKARVRDMNAFVKGVDASQRTGLNAQLK